MAPIWLLLAAIVLTGSLLVTSPWRLSVVMVAIFGMIFLGEKLSPLHWAGLVLVAGGAVLLAIQ